METPLRSEHVEPLRVRLFGTPLVSYAGKPVRFVAARTLPLFAYLLLGRDRPIARDQLAYTFWPDSSEDEARGNLRRHLHRINAPLFEVSGQRWLESNDRIIAFNPRMPLDLDVARLDAASSNTADAAEAVELYVGELFVGCDEDWLIPHRERLRSTYLRLLVGLVDRFRGERRFAEAIAFSRKILNVDPFREDAVRTLMSLHYESGDRSSALSEFQSFRELLQIEIGADPMHETQSLHDAIRRHAAVGVQQIDSPSHERAMPFAGRENEIDALRDAWRQAAGGRGRVAMVSGEAGIGKTRLLREFATVAEREGARVLWGASSAPEAVPYEPVTEALTGAIGEIARLSLPPALLSALAIRFPELHVAQPDIPETVGLVDQRERERFFDAIARAIEGLCATRPTVIIFEDLHWVFADTLDLITRIARTCARAPLLAILSFREEEMNGALRAFRLDPAMKQAARIALGRLDSTACRKILESGYQTVTHDVGEWAIDLANGNPLFLSELIRQYDERTSEDPLRADNLPTSLESAILSRLSTLSEGARSLVDIAAIGDSVVSIDLLQYASGWPLAEVLDMTDELVEHFVLRETATGSRGDYEFAHELIRDAVIRSMPSALQTRRHRRFAKAMLRLFPTRRDEFARTLAQHFEKAGQLDEAALFYARAATVANDQFAWQDALALAERGLELESQSRERFALHAIIESAALKSGSGERQRAAIATMLEIADALDDDALRGIALQRSSEYGLQTGDFERQRQVTDRLEAVAIASGDKKLLCTARRCRARGEIAYGQPAQAVTIMQSIDAIERHDRPLSEQIEDLRMLAFAQERNANFDAARIAIEEAERRAGPHPALSDQVAFVRLRINLAFAMSDGTEAARLSPLLLDLCRQIGDVEGEGNALQNAAQVDMRSFDVASARTHNRAASAIFERIGKLQARAAIAINSGTVENKVGLLDDAERFYAEGLAFADRLNHASLRSLCYANFAYIALLKGDAERALSQAQMALDIAREAEITWLIAHCLSDVGWALRELDRDYERSFAIFMEALDMCVTFGFKDERLELLCDMLPTLIGVGRLETAAGFAAELELAIASDSNAVIMPVHALTITGDVHEARGDEAKSRASRERARALLCERLEKLPDERTRAAYATLRFHRPLLEVPVTQAYSRKSEP